MIKGIIDAQTKSYPSIISNYETFPHSFSKGFSHTSKIFKSEGYAIRPIVGIMFFRAAK